MYKLVYKIKSVFFTMILKFRKKLTGKLIILEGKVWFRSEKKSRIYIKNKLVLGKNSYGNNGRKTLLRMDENSILEVTGNASIFYGCDVILFKNSRFTIGDSFINSDAKIRCHKSISIGDGCAISHDFTIMDSNAHFINGDNNTKPIVIKDNVWIGTRVTVLSGVTIGEGAVIGANSLVTEDVPPYTLVAGSPARVIKENIKWDL